MMLKKKTVSSWTDNVDFQDHYGFGNIKIYNSSDSNFQSSYWSNGWWTTCL